MDLCCVGVLLGMVGAYVEALLDMGGALGLPSSLRCCNSQARPH
jgi:hypothetical protein